MELDPAARRAAGAIAAGTALLVVAGPGVGTPLSALPSPEAFKRRPERAWGRFAAALAQLRTTAVHPALVTLTRWAGATRDGAFAITTNPCGSLQRARFDSWRIHECLGALEWLQCARGCGLPPKPGGLLDVRVGPRGRAEPPLPTCSCGALLRPNVILGTDGGSRRDAVDRTWDPSRAGSQEHALDAWLAELRGRPDARLVVLEVGASGPVGAIARARAERVAAAFRAARVRIDPEVRPAASSSEVVVAAPVEEGLHAIEAAFATVAFASPVRPARPRSAFAHR